MDDVLNHDFPACLFQIAMVSHRADHLDHGPFHLEEQRVSSELHSGSPSSKAEASILLGWSRRERVIVLDLRPDPWHHLLQERPTRTQASCWLRCHAHQTGVLSHLRASQGCTSHCSRGQAFRLKTKLWCFASRTTPCRAGLATGTLLTPRA